MLGTELGLTWCGLVHLSSKQPDEAEAVMTRLDHKAS